MEDATSEPNACGARELVANGNEAGAPDSAPVTASEVTIERMFPFVS